MPFRRNFSTFGLTTQRSAAFAVGMSVRPSAYMSVTLVSQCLNGSRYLNMHDAVR